MTRRITRRELRKRTSLSGERISFTICGSSSSPPDAILGPRLTLREQRGGDEGLERRSGLEGFGDRGGRWRDHAVAIPGHREQLAAARIENDDVAAFRVHVRDRVGQRALRDVLQLV